MHGWERAKGKSCESFYSSGVTGKKYFARALKRHDPHQGHVALSLPCCVALEEPKVGAGFKAVLAEDAGKLEIGGAHEAADDVHLRHPLAKCGKVRPVGWRRKAEGRLSCRVRLKLRCFMAVFFYLLCNCKAPTSRAVSALRGALRTCSGALRSCIRKPLNLYKSTPFCNLSLEG